MLLDRAGEPLLTDFGLAKDMSDHASRGVTVTGQVMGTPPAYMPPEQASGSNEAVDRRSDVYALGLTPHQREVSPDTS